jgi:sigma-E factor negative regulatory protein RseC
MKRLDPHTNLPTEGEIGLVTEIRPGAAELQVQEGTACRSCHAHSCCTLVREGTRSVTARDPIGVKRGQRVMFYVLPTNVLKASVLAFLIPLCGMIAGGLMGYWVGGRTEHPNAAGALGVVGALLLAAITFFSIRFIDRKYGITQSYLPVIGSILEAGDPEQSEKLTARVEETTD